MTSQPGKRTIPIHKLPSNSRMKGNQAMKFGQLIEYNMINIFLEKSYIKCGGETAPRPSSKIEIEHISGSIVLKLYSLFLLYAKFRATEVY